MTRDIIDRHDVELAALAAAGGRREFGELVRRHGSAVRGLLRRMGAQATLADDIAQDAFIQAFERITRHMLAGGVTADIVIELDGDRAVRHIRDHGGA